MSTIQAIIMGIVQGLTEFLPVSSSGHLVIFGKILGMQLEHGALFEVILHVGTLLAIIFAYSKDVWMLIKEGIGLIIDIFKMILYYIFKLMGNKNLKKIQVVKTEERKLVVLIIVASIPTAVIGLLFQNIVENILMKSLFTTGTALIITGFLLKISDKIAIGKKKASTATYKNAVVVGIIQGLAIIPGISRSGSTIVGGLLNGFNKEFAIKFSFLISLPAVGGAALLKISEVPFEILAVNFAPYLFGMLTSAVVGFICIKALLVMLRKNVFHYFSYYCFTVGLIAIIWGTFIVK